MMLQFGKLLDLGDVLREPDALRPLALGVAWRPVRARAMADTLAHTASPWRGRTLRGGWIAAVALWLLIVALALYVPALAALSVF